MLRGAKQKTLNKAISSTAMTISGFPIYITGASYLKTTAHQTVLNFEFDLQYGGLQPTPSKISGFTQLVAYQLVYKGMPFHLPARHCTQYTLLESLCKISTHFRFSHIIAVIGAVLVNSKEDDFRLTTIIAITSFLCNVDFARFISISL